MSEVLAIKIIYGTGEVIVPPLTWNSDINAVIQNNFKPKFVDINLNTLSMDPNKVIKNLNIGLAMTTMSVLL